VERLLSEGVTVRCFLRASSDHRWLNGLRIERCYGTLDDVQSIKDAVNGVDIIYHLAGATKARSRGEYRTVNTEGTRAIFDAAVNGAPHAQFVFLSSLAAAGPCRDARGLSESDVCAPISYYGRSKMDSEQILLEDKTGLKWVILRPPPVYGPRDTEILAFFKLVARGVIPSLGKREKHLSLIYVSDLVEALLLAGTKSEIGGKIFFTAHPEVITYLQLGEAAAKAIGRSKYVYIKVPERVIAGAAALNEIGAGIRGSVSALNRQKAREIAFDSWVVDTRRARDELGFSARIGITEGARFTIEWYKAHGWL
jgi:dihydroflavonol-4-reductase